MRANISIFSVIRNTGLLFLGMILALGMALFFPDPSFRQEKKQDSADVFFDTPLNKEIGTSLNIYAVVFLHDYGPGYLRNLGINNMLQRTALKVADRKMMSYHINID